MTKFNNHPCCLQNAEATGSPEVSSSAVPQLLAAAVLQLPQLCLLASHGCPCADKTEQFSTQLMLSFPPPHSSCSHFSTYCSLLPTPPAVGAVVAGAEPRYPCVFIKRRKSTGSYVSHSCPAEITNMVQMHMAKGFLFLNKS